MSPVTPAFAKLKPDRARFYPHIAKDKWWRVIGSNELGVRVELSHPLSSHHELFLFWQDIDNKQEPWPA